MSNVKTQNHEESLKYHAITIHQPWAELILRRRKRFEFRTINFHHRGPLLIHASSTWASDEDRYLGVRRDKVPAGAFVGVAKIDDVRRLTKDDVALLRRKKGGRAAIGDLAWVLTSVHRLADPIPFKGMQGIFTPPPRAVKAAQEAFARAQRIAGKAARTRRVRAKR